VRFELETLVRTGSWDVEFDSIRVVFEPGGLRRLGELVRDLGAGRVLVVTDRGVSETGHVDRAVRFLREAGIEAQVFDGVVENPTTRIVEEAARAAKEHEVECLVGLGGGSTMDCAKGVNFLVTQGGRMEDYWGSGKATKPMLPSVGVPTTAGTGSEMQSYALISKEETKVKMACGDRKARFRSIILDPKLTATAPRSVAAVSGIDAVSHAVESYVSTRRNPVSQPFAKEAWRLLEWSLPTALQSPGDDEARGRVQVGALLAGASIEHSMLGAAHACANPLTARCGVTHGIAVGVMLPQTVRFNVSEVGELYGELHKGTRAEGRGVSLYERILELKEIAGLPESLRECGVPHNLLPRLAAEAADQWTAGFNPRPVAQKELLALYEAAY
jgi:alcohol dehydrogenase